MNVNLPPDRLVSLQVSAEHLSGGVDSVCVGWFKGVLLKWPVLTVKNR